MYLDPKAMEQCRNVDILTCNADELVDLQDVHVDTSLPVRERLDGFVRQVRNPYLFRVDDLVVKAVYVTGAKRRLSDAIPCLLIP